jgi:hypothetical protein
MKKIAVSLILTLTVLISMKSVYAKDLIWEASSGDVAGYKIFYGTSVNDYSSVIDVGNTLQYSLDSIPLAEGKTYYFIVKAYNSKGESAESNSISYTLGDATPPLPPTGLEFDTKTQILSWEPNDEPDVSGYNFYYGTSSRDYGPPVSLGNVSSHSLSGFEDQTYGALTATDTSGNESGYSQEVSIKTTEEPPAGSTLPQAEWKLVYTDSEETVGEDGAAVNAFDGNATTIWHTQWSGANPPHPHEIQIDLGQIYELSGFIYLPRSNSQNGRILEYEFYVSTDGSNWGEPVATGKFSNTASEQEALFSAKKGQFIRLKALSEVNGKPWTSVAELNVIGAEIVEIEIDEEAPLVSITLPALSGRYETSSSAVDISGTASDNIEVTEVSWTSSSGGSGTASGTSSWSIADADLEEGDNVFTISAVDAAGNTSDDAITITYVPPDNESPSVSITSPSSSGTYKTSSPSVDISGTASDNIEVTEVSWTSSSGGSGTAAGTSSWSIADADLEEGDNVFTISAVDAAGNRSSDIITIDYAKPAPVVTPEVIPQTEWKMVYTDSEETVGEDGAAVNAFDGNATTIWHTQWRDAEPPHPHEIQINLGQIYELSGFLYLPRSNSQNGRILEYEFYVSTDGSNWGEPVATGKFSNTASEQEATFSAKKGQFIRLKALSEVNGKPWSSVAEINVLGISGNFGVFTDEENPSVSITSPASSGTYETSSSAVDISGTASDNIEVTKVSWTSSSGGSGNASGTSSWSIADADLQEGDNVFTISAVDAAGNTSDDAITITYVPPDNESPSVSITSPSSSGTYKTSSPSVDISGTASDNIEVTEVSWTSSSGGSGTAAGTSSWSIADADLEEGDNVFTISAVDAAGNRSSDIITIDYAKPAPVVTPEVIPQTEWKMVYTDSEETVGEDGAAVNAFDGNATTIWHTQWRDAEPPHPHEIQINLGQIYELSGFLYLPRSNSQNGRILEYEFYVSTDGSNWGEPVATGKFSNTASEQEATFSAKKGQFIRLKALSEVNGKPWSSVAEINVLGISGNFGVFTDEENPSVSITSPASSGTYETSSSAVDISGTASDNIEVTKVSWTSSSGGSGNASGTSSWSIADADLQEGDNVFTISAVDAAGNTSDDAITITYVPPDNESPSVSITSPSSSGTYKTSSPSVDISGTASDNIEVTEVSWTSSSGGSGTASGTSSWSIADADLEEGDNVFTISAVDAAGNTSDDAITITYVPPDNESPSVSITSPSSSGTYKTSSPSVDISGTASDNIEVTEVSWNSSSGGSGTASGTSSWSIADADLEEGDNVFTISAVDAAGNRSSDTITIDYAKPAPVVTPEVIPQTEWKLVYTDSEETVGEDGAAVNAFDGNATTIWHTQWKDAEPPHPHEIQIDLGQSYEISGFRYLARSNSQNGRILDYEIYISTDGSNWGSLVTSGKFSNTSAEQEKTFSAETGRYIKLKALSEVNGKPWTSAAEINVIALQ